MLANSSYLEQHEESCTEGKGLFTEGLTDRRHK